MYRETASPAGAELVFRTDAWRLAGAAAYARLSGCPACFAGAPMLMRPQATHALPGPQWARVRTRLAGICGSDLALLRLDFSPDIAQAAQRSAGSGACLFPGHETVGEVVELGAQVQDLKLGQRVLLVPGVECASFGEPPCHWCARGQFSLCRIRESRGQPAGIGGGWGSHFMRLGKQLRPLPQGLSDELAVLAEPLACALHAVLRRAPRAGERLLVIGAGMIGLGVVAVLRALALPLHITVLTRHAFQSQAARRLGADAVIESEPEAAYAPLALALGTRVLGRSPHNRLLDDGFDIVHDSVGNAHSIGHAMRWVRSRGHVVVTGLAARAGRLDHSPLWWRELTLMGANGHGLDECGGVSQHSIDHVLAWLAQRRLQAPGLLTHVLPSSAWREAFAIAAGKRQSKAIRVALDFRR